MDQNLENYLANCIESFVMSAISRLAHSGNMEYEFYISDNELKNGSDRKRIFKEDVIAFFHRKKIQAEYYDGGYSVTVDLDRCAFSPDQARFLSTAMAAYRAEHN